MLLFNIEEGGSSNHPLIGKWGELIPKSTLDTLELTLNRVEAERKNSIVYPAEKDVFKAFELDYEEVKVVVLGQDPYYTKNQATGLAFACGNYCSPSLRVIGEHLDYTFPKEIPIGGIDLLHWQKQGVLMLNTILTVSAKGKALSHSKIGWQHFTSEVIHQLSKYNTDIVWMLWGEKAYEFRSYITEGVIYKSEHPMNAGRSKREWDTNCFHTANQYLTEINKEPIKWKFYYE